MSRKLMVFVIEVIFFMCKSIKLMLFLALTSLSGLAASALPVPDSEINYPGASTTKAFVAIEPYTVNIQNVSKTISLEGASRSHDFSGTVPFVNPATNKNDPYVFQAWSSGLVNWHGSQIKDTGVPGRIDKAIFGSDPVTMIKYNAGDDIAIEKCRTKLGTFPVPPRTHVRWELEVAFGKADGVNDWVLTPSAHWSSTGIDNGGSPVLFWALTSHSQSNGPLGFDVDTDELDPTKLMIMVGQRVGTATKKTEIARIHGISRHTIIPIVVESFLDERAAANGGKGLLQIWINNSLVLEKIGPTLALGTEPHYWSIDTYLWNEPNPYHYSRATFYKTARMMVFPAGMSTAEPAPAVDTTAPSAPANLAATTPDSSKVNLSWSTSTDNVGVTGYNIYRDGTKIGTSATTSFTDSSVVGGTAYNYTIKAYDAASNLSAVSNAVKVNIANKINITSYYVNSIAKWTAKVNWTTNVPSTGIVYYGTNSTNLNLSVSFNSLNTVHALTLNLLNRNTSYSYKIVAKDSGGVSTTSAVAKFTTAS
jgi:hypothetical protein